VIEQIRGRNVELTTNETSKSFSEKLCETSKSIQFKPIVNFLEHAILLPESIYCYLNPTPVQSIFLRPNPNPNLLLYALTLTLTLTLTAFYMKQKVDNSIRSFTIVS